MRRGIFLCLILSLFSVVAIAQKKERNTIKEMCGCYEVKFNFAETFNFSKDAEYLPSPIKQTGGLEWVQLVTDEKNKISLQHLLIVGPPEGQMVVKHWRQDWEFQNTDLYIYNRDNQWSYIKLAKEDVKGQWSQKVFQVDDSPRYEGSGSWVFVDGKKYWENQTAAPLPRREYTIRSDYNVTLRTNRQELTDNGWVHKQENQKVVRNEGEKDFVLAYEQGLNTYTKVDDSLCIAAQDFWKKNQAMWAMVRDKWDRVFAENKDLTLHSKVDNKVLWKHLADTEKYNNQEAIDVLIDSFIIKK